MTKVLSERRKKVAYCQDLVGKTVASVEELSPAEYEYFGWYSGDCPAVNLGFTDGTQVLVCQDPEGNGQGYLMVAGPDKF